MLLLRILMYLRLCNIIESPHCTTTTAGNGYEIKSHCHVDFAASQDSDDNNS